MTKESWENLTIMWAQAPQNGIEPKVSFGKWANNGKAILGKIRNVPFLTKLGVNEGKELSFKYWDRMSTT